MEKKMNEYLELITRDKKTLLFDIIILMLSIFFINTIFYAGIEMWEVFDNSQYKEVDYWTIENKDYQRIYEKYNQYVVLKPNQEMNDSKTWIKLGRYIDLIIKHEIYKEDMAIKTKYEEEIKKLEEDDILKSKYEEIKKVLAK